MGKIVVGVDGSDSSKRALEWALAQARLSGDELAVVTSWEIPVWVVSGSATASAEPMIDIDFAGEAKRHLQETVAAVIGSGTRSDVKITEVVAEGHPSLALLREAEDADLLVVGSRGHGEFTGMLLGSVSMYVTAYATCPVVVVRTKDEHREHK